MISKLSAILYSAIILIVIGFNVITKDYFTSALLVPALFLIYAWFINQQRLNALNQTVNTLMKNAHKLAAANANMKKRISTFERSIVEMGYLEGMSYLYDKIKSLIK